MFPQGTLAHIGMGTRQPFETNMDRWARGQVGSRMCVRAYERICRKAGGRVHGQRAGEAIRHTWRGREGRLLGGQAGRVGGRAGVHALMCACVCAGRREAGGWPRGQACVGCLASVRCGVTDTCMGHQGVVWAGPGGHSGSKLDPGHRS